MADEENQQVLFNPKDIDQWNSFRQNSAQATRGINSMPFVFGGGDNSYAKLSGMTPQDLMNLFYGGGMSWGSPAGASGSSGGFTSGGSSAGGSPFSFASGDLFSRYGLFTGRDAFSNPLGNTPLTVDWTGNSQQIPAWATSQAAAMTGLNAYHQVGANPPPQLIQQTNDIAMQLFTSGGSSGGRQG
jgi:hypothetical protein